MKPEFIYMDLVAPAFILVPLFTAIVRYRWLTSAARVLMFYLLIDAVVSIISSALAYHKKPNTALYHIATIIDTVLLLYFFSLVFAERTWAKYLRAGMIVFPVLAILNILLLQPMSSFNSHMLSVKSLLVVSLCFLYWWHHEPERSWQSTPLHWMISGLLLYFASAFLLFTFSSLIMSVSSRSFSIVLWNIHASLSILMFLLLAVGFFKYKT